MPAISHRRFAAACAFCAGLAQALPAAAAGPAWQPARPLEIVSSSAAGGSVDLIARTLQSVLVREKLSPTPVTVLNKPGGSGTVSIAFVNSHPRDGHYVTIQDLPLITNRITGQSTVGLDDVTPLALLLTEQVVFSVAADSSIKNGQDLIKRLRADPASVSIGVSSSPGGQSHDAAALVLQATGQDPKKLKIVFFDSGGQAVTALMGQHVMATVTSTSVVLGPAQGGKVRIIATPAATRQGGALAAVPTWKELGLDVQFNTWRVLVGPKGMTPAEIAWWDQALRKATASPEWLAAAKRNLWTPDYKDSAATGVFLRAQRTKLTPLLTQLGLAK